MRLLITVWIVGAVCAHADEPEPARILGVLEPKRKTDEGALHVRVGPTTYELTLDDAGRAAARRLRGKFVAVLTRLPATDIKPVERATVEVVSLAVQKPTVLRGTVRRQPDAKRAKAFPLRLGQYDVPARDARKFRKFVDLHVAAEAYRVTNGVHGELASVKSVKRELAPGERNPRKGAEAFAGAWKGTVKAEHVPRGVPARPGDTLDVHFTATPDKKDRLEAKGQLMGTYEILEVRVRKFGLRKRTAEFDLGYTFGTGYSFYVRFAGTFAADWKTFTGTYKSNYLGSGTCAIRWSES